MEASLVKKEVEITMASIVSTQTKEKENLLSAYPIVKTLCEQISAGIKQNLPVLPDEVDEVPIWWQNLSKLAQAISEEPIKIRTRSAEISGFLKGVGMTISQIAAEEEKVNQPKRIEKKIEDVAKKISTGEINPDDRRKVGDRPESLKTLRMAQAKLSEDDN